MSKTIGEALKDMQDLRTNKEANEYLISALKENPNAWTNIKYVVGYLGTEERNRILNLFSWK